MKKKTLKFKAINSDSFKEFWSIDLNIKFNGFPNGILEYSTIYEFDENNIIIAGDVVIDDDGDIEKSNILVFFKRTRTHGK